MLKAEIIGHIGADATVVRNNDGCFVSFRVAHSVRTTDTQTGQVSERTSWVSITLNGDGGGLLQYLKKGTKIYVRGNLSSRLYVGNDGLKHAGLNVFATEIELCSSRTRLEDVQRFIDDVPEARQNVSNYLWKYADQNPNNISGDEGDR